MLSRPPGLRGPSKISHLSFDQLPPFYLVVQHENHGETGHIAGLEDDQLSLSWSSSFSLYDTVQMIPIAAKQSLVVCFSV